MTKRTFRVTVDGETFEVEVEELSAEDGAPTSTSAAGPGRAVGTAAPPAGPAPRPTPPAGPAGRAGGRGAGPRRQAAAAAAGAADPAARDGASGGGQAVQRRPVTANGDGVEAPLPGTVVAVRVSPGQAVSSGDVLVVLEAMKMQNEIVSPRDGVVKEVLVARGDTVGLGDVLVTVG